MKKAVVKVSVNAGDRHPSAGRSILIGLAKVIMPWGYLWEKMTPTAAQNKTKALKVAVSLPGVCEAGLEGEELVVKGKDDFDPVILIGKLREKVASAEIVSVGPDKKEDPPEKKKDPEEEKKVAPVVVYDPYHYYGAPNLQLVEIPEPTPFCRFW